MARGAGLPQSRDRRKVFSEGHSAQLCSGSPSSSSSRPSPSPAPSSSIRPGDHDLSHGIFALLFAVLSAQIALNWFLWKDDEE